MLSSGGLTFLEMGYMLMQAYDFCHLNKTCGCSLQIGGSGQWGNIVAETMLYRKMNFLYNMSGSEEIIGMTNPLLLTKEGEKMGKTESGTLWVAREKTTSFEFCQYFYNVDDADVDTLLRLFTQVPLEEIERLIHLDILDAKRLMAYEITKLVHGESEAKAVVKMISGLFNSSGAAPADAPSCSLSMSKLQTGYPPIDMILDSQLCPSKSEARCLITQGGISVNGKKVYKKLLFV